MNPTAAVIRRELAAHGTLSFARFMELALYAPGTGYYETAANNVGRAGDFITSVSAGELFGELLAYQFADWLDALPLPTRTRHLVEAGAHDGQLAADILRWLRAHRPELFANLEYWIIEPSPARQAWQQTTLLEFAPHVRWHAHWPVTPAPPVNGIIFSNELLDAFPVHRYGWDAAAQQWFEWGVTLAAGEFAWTKLPATPAALPALPAELLALLPDGYIYETSPAAESWWHAAATQLAQGKLLAIDYGLVDAEQFSPARTRGTLRAYHRHRVTDDLLAQPGEQDLTAHVNFSTLQRTGELAGLRTDQLSPQPSFLTRILGAAMQTKTMTGLTAKQVRQFQTLTHPEHLGRAFRVLVQTRLPAASEPR